MKDCKRRVLMGGLVLAFAAVFIAVIVSLTEAAAVDGFKIWVIFKGMKEEDMAMFGSERLFVG